MARRLAHFDPYPNLARQYGFVDDEEEEQVVSVAKPKPKPRLVSRKSKHFDPYPNLARQYGYVEEPAEEDYEAIGGRDTPAGRVISKAAAALAYLKRQSAWYPGIGWAVGAYLNSKNEGICYAVSNEGRGYLPYGLRWDPEVRPVFGLSVPVGHSPSWQGAANPARVIADHYEHQRQLSGGAMQLATILATAPLGRPVIDMMREREAEQATTVLFSPALLAGDRRVRRLDTVSPELFRGSVQPVPGRMRWEAACALAASAVETSGVANQHAFVPQALALARSRQDSDVNSLVRKTYWRLAAQAQALRVEDERAGAVLLNPDPGSKAEQDVLPSGGILGYAKLFWGARACSILDRLTDFVARGRELDAEDLAELAYEHYCVVENVAATAEILGRFS